MITSVEFISSTQVLINCAGEIEIYCSTLAPTFVIAGLTGTINYSTYSVTYDGRTFYQGTPYLWATSWVTSSPLYRDRASPFSNGLSSLEAAVKKDIEMAARMLRARNNADKKCFL